MEKAKMTLPEKPHFPVLISGVLIALILLSCNFLTGPTSNPLPASTSDQTVGETPAGANQSPSSSDAPTAAPDPLDHLLGMRSITIHLTTQRPDGSSSSTQIDIDNTGNMHVKSSLPAMTPEPEALPQGVEAPKMPTTNELLVVDGKAYHPFDQDPTWMTTPVDENYIQTLSRNLHGADGVALWLDVLPEGSITSAGQEKAGGFDADKYTVNGKVNGQSITGTLWYEPQANALIKADLTVPAALYDVMDKSPQGQLTISLDTQKSNIPPVTLPSAPAPTAQP
jgi:hypothetical protein